MVGLALDVAPPKLSPDPAGWDLPKLARDDDDNEDVEGRNDDGAVGTGSTV